MDEGGTGRVIALGSAALVLFLALIVGLQSYHHAAAQRLMQHKALVQGTAEIARLKASQQALLDGYRWIDKNAGTAAVPIGKAMEMIIREYAEPVQESRPVPLR